MSKHYHAPNGLTWTRLEGEPVLALQWLIAVSFGELLAQDVADWVKAGRGLVLIRFKGSTIGSIQPPCYVLATGWQEAQPLVTREIQEEVNQGLAQYNPAREYLVFIVSQDSDRAGSFAWWVARRPTLPGAFPLWKAPRS